MNRAFALALAIFIGFSAVAIPTVSRPRLVAGSVPDLVCGVMLAPGWLVANLFIHEDPESPEFRRRTASPEILWLSRLVTFIFFGGVAYGVLSIKKPTI
jgi:hypothetical protein